MSGTDVRKLPGVTLTVNFRQPSPSPPSSSTFLSPPIHHHLHHPSASLFTDNKQFITQPVVATVPMFPSQQQQLPSMMQQKLEFTRVTATENDQLPPPLLSPNQARSPGYELDIRIIDISSEAFAKRIRNRTNTSSSSKSTSSSRYEHSSSSDSHHNNQRTTPSRHASGSSRHTSPNHPYIVFKSSSNPSDKTSRAEKKSSKPSSSLDPNNLSPVTHREVVKKVIRKDKLENAPLPGIACQICGTRKTGQWRRGPDGPRTLCNGCGLAFARLKKK